MTIHVKYYCKKAGDHSSTIYHYQNLSHCWDDKCKVTSNKLLAVVTFRERLDCQAMNLYLTIYKQTNKLLNCSQKKERKLTGSTIFKFSDIFKYETNIGKE